MWRWLEVIRMFYSCLYIRAPKICAQRALISVNLQGFIGELNSFLGVVINVYYWIIYVIVGKVGWECCDGGMSSMSKLAETDTKVGCSFSTPWGSLELMVKSVLFTRHLGSMWSWLQAFLRGTGVVTVRFFWAPNSGDENAQKVQMRYEDKWLNIF